MHSRILLLCLTLLINFSYSWAQDTAFGEGPRYYIPKQGVTGELIRVHVEYNQSFTVLYKIIPGFSLKTNRSSTQYKSEGGVVSQVFSRTLLLQSTEVGKLVLKPITIISDQDTFYSPESMIELFPRDSNNLRARGPKGLILLDSIADLRPEDLWIEVDQDKQRLKKNDTLRIRFTYYSGLSNRIVIRHVAGLASKQHILERGELQDDGLSVIRRDGHPFRTQEFLELKLIPQKKGDFVLDEGKITIAIGMFTPRGKDNIFGKTHFEEVEIAIPEIRFTVE